MILESVYLARRDRIAERILYFIFFLKFSLLTREVDVQTQVLVVDVYFREALDYKH